MNEAIEIDDAVVYAQPSKQKQEEVTNRLVEAVTTGLINPLQLLVKLRFCEKIIKDTIDGITANCVEEADKYARGEDIKMLGATLKMKEAGTKFNYENCNDPVYADLTEKSGKMTDMIKERENFLKSLKQPMTIVDDSTGEVVTIAPPLKTSKTIVDVKLS